MPRAASTRAGTRAGYGLTCSKCRARKIKCDGRRPECGICLAYGEACHYDKPPSMSQVLAMSNRIEELERENAQLRTNHGNSSSTAIDLASPNMGTTGSVSSSTLAGTMNVEVRRGSRIHQIPQYQSTSAVDDPVAEADEISTESVSSTAQSYALTTMNEQQIQYWEEAALPACALMAHLSVEKLSHLLRTHWTWVYPTFLFVPRPFFLRAAASDGEHCSTLLLNVICLHSTRFTDHSLSDDLLSRVRLMLSQELHKGSSAPTVQALLQLSAREIGRGDRSQAWLYSGIAFRSAIDLGCFSKYKPASEATVDRLIKEQLAWSCYLWDKAISLYLGRAPALPEAPAFDPPPSDPVAETMDWSCYPEVNAKAQCGSIPAYTMSCFANFCRLAPVITDVLLNIYGKRMPNETGPLLQNLKNRLDSWRAESPGHLKVDKSTLICPPPHILTQNLLYHATSILLHRPFWGNELCRSVCRAGAEEVEHLFLLLEKSYGLQHVTYLMAYCAYTAATVAVMDGSQMKINTYLRALFAIRASCPGIQSSIDLIIKGLDNRAERAPVAKPNPLQWENTLPSDPLPAFPFDQVQDHDYGVLDDVDSIPFGSLGSFPFEWSNIANDEFGIAS